MYKRQVFSCEKQGENQVYLRVEDNGIGISKEDLPYIFDKGYVGKNLRKGDYHSTGMGLYFAGKILGIGSVYHNLKNTFLFLEETYLLYYLIGIIFVIVIGWKIYSKERNVLKAERERIIVTIFTGIALLCGITRCV